MDASTFRKVIMPSAIFQTRSVGGVAAPIFVDRDTPEARCLMTAIAGVESGWSARVQVPNGQAHGFWQCEEHGAVLDVLTRPSVAPIMAAVCTSLEINRGLTDVFEAIVYNDTLAYAVARLTLYLDPTALPAIGDEEGSWQYYLSNWRPGKPDRDRWAIVYPQATAVSV